MAMLKPEILAPAGNWDCVRAAVANGADAVYFGLDQFNARMRADNFTREDLGTLVPFLHECGVRAYVTMNVLIFPAEMAQAMEYVDALDAAGVDGVIVQDLGLADLIARHRKQGRLKIELHISTQMTVSSPEAVRLVDALFDPQQIVLARELSLKEIRAIHDAVPETELEVFVHGALCVSYSGQCYASQHCFDRSANRGACAQFCRLSFDMVDAEGEVIAKGKHLLSLKDMNRSGYVEQMLDAGVTSFKIEGRLKDISYVKNITAYYRKKLDEVFARRPEYLRASYGSCYPQFTPSPEKSFSRGFTDYMLHGDKESMTSFDTPKSKGEYMGRVKFVSRNFFTFTGKEFNNGDGACFIASDGRLKGFHINRVEGNRIFPQTMPLVESGDEIYRNYDCDFERQLSRPDAPRRMRIDLSFGETADGFVLKGKDESGMECSVSAAFEKQEARTSQHDNIVKQLGKWGNTPFEVGDVRVEFSNEWFVPSSLLSDMRRSLCEALVEKHIKDYGREDMRLLDNAIPFVTEKLDYKGNVSNSYAGAFYKQHGVKSILPAFEKQPVVDTAVMFCKHCIKYSMGWCTKNGERHPYKEPFYIVSGDGKRFRLSFDCKECIMKVIPDNR